MEKSVAEKWFSGKPWNANRYIILDDLLRFAYISSVNVVTRYKYLYIPIF